MKKRFNRSILMALAAVTVASGLLAGCGQKAAIGGADAATEITIRDAELPESETAGETEAAEKESEVYIERFGGDETGEEQESEDMYIDMQPVSKWGTIASVDVDNNRISFNSNEYMEDEAGNLTETVSEIILHVGKGTVILDGTTLMPVQLKDLGTEGTAYVWVSQAMTMSLPPQTTAQVIITNVPEDASAPMYVIAKEVERTDEGIMITDQDGVVWRADQDTIVTPYLTRNIVTLDDIDAGTRMIVSQGSETSTSGTEKAGDADAYAANIMVFAG